MNINILQNGVNLLEKNLNTSKGKTVLVQMLKVILNFAQAWG